MATPLPNVDMDHHTGDAISTCRNALRRRDYLPIENYGVIGNLHTVALVSRNDASIDFFCYPDFDSPSIFARLLDTKKGGFFGISPRTCSSSLTTTTTSDMTGRSSAYSRASVSSSECLGGHEPVPCGHATFKAKQLYLPSSNVLLTRFSGSEGISQVSDLMPIKEDGSPSYPWLIRKVEAIRGFVSLHVTCQPAFDYGRATHTLSITPVDISSSRSSLTCRPLVLFKSQNLSMELCYIFHDSSDYSTQEEESVRSSYNNTYTAMTEDGETCFPHMEWKVVGPGNRPGVSAFVSLMENQSILFVLRAVSEPTNTLNCPGIPEPNYSLLNELIQGTVRYWQKWINKCSYKGRWRETVHRSALVLKLLTYAPTGAIIAAPTFGLPEEIGGPFNWDYRFTWIRDAAFTVYAFIRIGFKEEAIQFVRWIEDRCRDSQESGNPLQILYDIHGRSPSFMIQKTKETWHHGFTDENVSVQNAHEMALDHLDGYRHSKPVRIGNAACLQVQLDIYGELMDAIYLVDKFCRPTSYTLWNLIRGQLIPAVIRDWQKSDHGIWEFRAGKQHYTYSKIMCWVAVDRAIRLADKRSFPAPRQEWLLVRDAIYSDIMENAWSEERASFVQYYGGQCLDASNMIMPLVFFLSPSDPRFIATLEATMNPSKKGGLLVNHLCFRTSYLPFDPRLGSTSEEENPTNGIVLLQREENGINCEGTFNLCTFWLVEALARAGHWLDPSYLERAVNMFENIIGYANHLGLFSEEISVSGEALGNFPQAFTHLALISAAFNIDRYLDGKES